MRDLLSIDDVILDVRQLFVSSPMSDQTKSKKKTVKNAGERVVKPTNPSKKRKLDASGAMTVMQDMQNSLDCLREQFLPSMVRKLTL